MTLLEKKSSLLQCSDLISRLPDDILISIISRMPTKDAARTSLLSRRWTNLSRFFPLYDIELRCSYLSKHHRLNLIDRLVYDVRRCLFAEEDDRHDPELILTSLDSFLSHHSSNKIHSLRLYCCLNESVTSRSEQCISSLRRMDVENLTLCCSCSLDWPSGGLPFSCPFFSEMPFLKYLELRCCSLQPSLRSQCNSTLQTIVLMRVVLSPGVLECILSDCLSLHSFSITDCVCPPKLRFCGLLKYLYINDCVFVEEIELYATNLLVFEFSGIARMVNLILDHVPMLQNVYLHWHQRNIFRYVCGSLALDLPNLKSLNFVTSGFDGHNIQDMEMNKFNNLRRLDIDILTRPGIDLRLLTSILHHCPLLQEFHLDVDVELSTDQPPVVKQQYVVFHSELKKMEITGFGGAEYEMEFALYILKSAINLKKMHISKCRNEYRLYRIDCSRTWSPRDAPPWSEEMQGMIHKKLQGQAVSKIAEVIIQHNTFHH